jgi:hypothetical protein
MVVSTRSALERAASITTGDASMMVQIPSIMIRAASIETAWRFIIVRQRQMLTVFRPYFPS